MWQNKHNQNECKDINAVFSWNGVLFHTNLAAKHTKSWNLSSLPRWVDDALMRDTRDTNSALLAMPLSRASLAIPVSCSRAASSRNTTSKCCCILSVGLHTQKCYFLHPVKQNLAYIIADFSYHTCLLFKILFLDWSIFTFRDEILSFVNYHIYESII